MRRVKGSGLASEHQNARYEPEIVQQHALELDLTL